MTARKITILVAALAGAILSTAATTFGATWRVPSRRFATIQAAVDNPAVFDGDTIVVRRGYHAGAVVTKRLVIKARLGAVINQHPPGATLYQDRFKIGFWFPGNGAGSGTIIDGFLFRGIHFPIFSAGANGVRVLRNRMLRPVQGITNWGGSGWRVRYNAIRSLRFMNGGGIGIFIGDYLANPAGVNGNRVVWNRVTGTLFGSPSDNGLYWGSGVALYADFRWGAAGAVRMANNRIVSNTVSLQETVQPVMVRTAGVELAEAENPIPEALVIRDNVVNFNDLTATRVKVKISPPGLAEVNIIQGYITAAGEDATRGDELAAWGGISPHR